MKSKIQPNLKYFVFLFLAMLVLQACSPETPSADIQQSPPPVAIETGAAETNALLDESNPENTGANPVISPTTIDTIPSGQLPAPEVDSLLFMREEEKLAHDVYLALYDLWGMQIFQNIANSEQNHTGAVARLLETYNIPDPADTSPPGTFVNSDLQALYDELTLLGAQSLGDALKVGAAIEEIDILDLQKDLAFIETSEIIRVYENLLRGSKNHLQAFTSTLSRQTGETYQPQYLTQEAYDEIIAGSSQQGARGNGRRP